MYVFVILHTTHLQCEDFCTKRGEDVENVTFESGDSLKRGGN